MANLSLAGSLHVVVLLSNSTPRPLILPMQLDLQPYDAKVVLAVVPLAVPLVKVVEVALLVAAYAALAVSSGLTA